MNIERGVYLHLICTELEHSIVYERLPQITRIFTNCFCAYSILILYLFYTYSILILYLFYTYSILILYLFYTYSILILYLFYTYSILILYLFYTYSILYFIQFVINHSHTVICEIRGKRKSIQS
ncbi:hypothetical protein C8C83_3158 [Flavobacterium sp. 90]|nr:hypothetical protein C8C82_3468 [Flavobacterium sp. 81]TCK55210.1 hypothetical protein C8C83_3158 [Flavobacterium sp. 90]